MVLVQLAIIVFFFRYTRSTTAASVRTVPGIALAIAKAMKGRILESFIARVAERCWILEL